MDKRTLLALGLMAIVIVATPLLFPGTRRPNAADSTALVAARADSQRGAAVTSTTTPTPVVPTVPSAAGTPSVGAAPPTLTGTARAAADSVVVSAPRMQLVLANPGAAPQSVHVAGFRNLRPGRRDSSALIAPTRGALLHYRLARGADTVALDSVPFTVATSGSTTTFTSPVITLSYRTVDSSYRTEVRGTVPGAAPGTALIIDLPRDLRSNEADTLDDQRHLAYGYRVPVRDPESIAFTKIDAGQSRVETGNFQWVNARNKYWIVALMQPVADNPAGTPSKQVGIFRGLSMTGGQRVGRVAPTAGATTVYPITNGNIAFDLYAGPQKFADLHAMANDLENANPYAGFLHAVVQPFATIVMKVLLWMKASLRINYGWVLVLFGVIIRVALWPLNQKAMRTSMQMQRIQPELQALQAKHKSDPEKQREAIMKLYASHNMSPLSPMLGCLPMLLPMPVLFALYHVFQNTVEFRGVSFLWLPDLSLRDPFYITPLVMGASMFLLSWIGMRQMPPNPQAKMMSYMMPVMFTVMFINFASGLNLYYAVQNLAALPQQWIISRERARAGITTAATKTASGPASATVKRRT
jgi:YidC/Oxa1 family membrane protein insertase